MLVFFIHGVATRDVQYAEQLKALMRQEFTNRGKSLPHFYSSFWGNVLRDVDKMWNGIEQDLQEIDKEYPITKTDEIFRYKKFREGFLSQFIGDFLAYLNPNRGVAIRKLIAQQLYDFLKDNPNETELHIIAHSLGSVILWDVLFSERFNSKDPAFYIRAMINDLNQYKVAYKVPLKSITTMGSPILFVNTMLDVKPEQVKQLADLYQDEPLRWINIIHSSDIVAYPLRTNLNLNSDNHLLFRDKYICADANLAEKAARAVGQFEAAMALGVSDAHSWYWNSHRTAHLITENIFGETQEPSSNTLIDVSSRLFKVPGMTNDSGDNAKTARVHLKFKDGSGTLRLFVNPIQVHHVFVFDQNEVCQFGGYVGWMHTEALKQEIEFIRRNFC